MYARPRRRRLFNRPPAGAERNTYVVDSVSGAIIRRRQAVRDPATGKWVHPRNIDTKPE